MSTTKATTVLPTITTATGGNSDFNADIVFIIDSTYRQGQDVPSTYWQDTIEFIVDFINAVTIGPSNTQVGFVIIGWPAQSPFYLNTYTTKSALIAAVQSLQYVAQWTHLASGLQEAVNNQFTVAHGDRPNYPNVAIVIMAIAADKGQSSTLSAAQAAWTTGISVITIGCTSAVNQTELQAVSSPPHTLDENYFLVPDPSSLLSLTSTLIQDFADEGSGSVVNVSE